MLCVCCVLCVVLCAVCCVSFDQLSWGVKAISTRLDKLFAKAADVVNESSHEVVSNPDEDPEVVLQLLDRCIEQVCVSVCVLCVYCVCTVCVLCVYCVCTVVCTVCVLWCVLCVYCVCAVYVYCVYCVYPKVVLHLLDRCIGQVEVIEHEASRCRYLEKIIGSAGRSYDPVQDAAGDVRAKHMLWDARRRWVACTQRWMSGAVRTLCADDIRAEAQAIAAQLAQSEHRLQGHAVLEDVKGLIKGFEQLLPFVDDICNSSLQSRHWKRMQELLGTDASCDQITIADLLEMGALSRVDDLHVISSLASREHAIRLVLDDVWVKWKGVLINVEPLHSTARNNTTNHHNNSNNSGAPSSYDNIWVLCSETDCRDDLIDAVDAVADTLHKENVWYTEALRLHCALQQCYELLTVWIAVQKTWLYLAVTFSRGDVRTALRAETQLCDALSRDWQQLMDDTRAFPQLLPMVADVNKLRQTSNNTTGGMMFASLLLLSS